MIKRFSLNLILICFITSKLIGQQPESGIYVDSLGQVYVQTNTPVYFFVAPDNKLESRIQITSKDLNANPMIFNSNGTHYITTQDAETNKPINFRIIADGIAPKISLLFKNGLLMNSGKRYYVDKGSVAELISKDNLSGSRRLFSSIDKSDFTNTKTILFDTGHDYLIEAYAIDNVGNISDTIRFRVITAVNSIVKINSIYFDINSSRLRPDSKIELNEFVQVLTEYPEIKIELRAHTDCTGDETYNLKLSEMRAETVANYLIYKGINPDRLTYKGYGDTAPLNECIKGVLCTDEKHQENRRVEFKILPIK